MSTQAAGRVVLAASQDHHRAVERTTHTRAYWWEAYVDDELVRQLIKDIEAAKGRQSTHEEVCALRYHGIQTTLDALKLDVKAIASNVTTEEKGGAKLIRGGLVALVMLLLSAVVWEASQLYALEPLRVAADHKR